MSDRTVSVSLALKISQYVQNAGQAAKSTKQIVDEVENLGKTSKSRFNDVTLATGAVGASLLGMAGYAAKAAMDFDRQMSEVGAVSNATGRQMEGLRALAIQAGKDTQYSATEAAKAEAELSKAGIGTADIMGGALSGSLALAAAGQMDLADAATIAAQTMNIFELKGKDVGHIADVLASAANTSAADMHGLGLGLAQVGLVAHQAGFSLEETVGVLAAFADRGLQGSDGATSLKTAIQRLTAPTDQAKTLMDGLGISVYDSNGKVKSAADLAGNLQTSLGKLSVEQRNAAMNTIFGSDAIRAANVLYGIGEDGVKRYTAAVDQNGAAADTARKKTDNLAGDLERLKGSIETLAIEAGSGANGGLRALVQGVDGLVGAFSSLPSPVQTSLTVLAGVGGAGLVATAGLLKVRQVGSDALDALRDMGPAGEKAATGLGKVGKIAGQATLWGIALYGAYEGAKLFINFLNSDVKGATRNVDDMARALVELGRSGQAVGELRNAFGSDLRRLTEGHDQFVRTQREMSTALHESKNGLQELGRAIAANNAEQAGLNDKQRKSNNDFTESITAVDKALADVVAKGGTTQAKLAYQELADTWVRSGKPLSELNALLPGYNKAIGDAAAGSGAAAQGFGTADQNARTMAGSLQAATQAGQSLKQVFDQLNGANISLTQAQVNAEAAVDNLTKALADNGGSMDITTDKGRAATQAAIDLATKGRDLAQATYDQTGSVEQARGVFETYRQQLIDNISTAGGTKKATDESRAAAKHLADQIMQMPEFKAIPVTVTGVDAAVEKVIGLASHLNGLQNKTVSVTTVQNTVTGETRNIIRSGREFQRWGGVTEHAATGLLRDANVYTAVSSGARYGFAEPQTRGEAFIPKSGNLERSRAIWGYVGANWLGMRPGGGGGGGSTVVNNIVNLNVNAGMGTDGSRVGQQIMDALRPIVQRNGGNVQIAVMGRQVP